ncbi:MAG: beta strand repeat-containing protein [Beijerinckiaceae bacterium]
MQIRKYLGATALLSVLAAPAFGQVIQTTPFGLTFGDTLYTDINIDNLANLSVLGRVVDVQALQVGTADVNVYTPGEVTGNFGTTLGTDGIYQGAGRFPNIFNGTPLDPTDDIAYGHIVVDIYNSAQSASTNLLPSNAITSGSQAGIVNVNSVGFIADGANTGVEGIILQGAGIDGGLLFIPQGGPSINVNNIMSATVRNGNATVAGMSYDGDTEEWVDGGFQYAIANLNSINLQVGKDGNGTLDLTAGQLLFNQTSIGLLNIAAATATNTTDPSLDPTVKNIDQVALASVNSIAFSSAIKDPAVVNNPDTAINEAYFTANVSLFGGQEAEPTDIGVGGRELYIRVGNVATAVAGTPDISLALNNPARYTALPSNGIVKIENVNQTSVVQLNSVTGTTGNVNLDLAGLGSIDPKSGAVPSIEAFEQDADGGQLTIIPVELSLGATNIVNLMVASSGNGSASILGSLEEGEGNRQVFSFSANSVNISGNLTGGLEQLAMDFDDVANFRNYASAQTLNGSATVQGLSQIMSMTLNSVAAGSTGQFVLEQIQEDDGEVSTSNYLQALAGGAAITMPTATVTGVLQANITSINSVDIAGVAAGADILQVLRDGDLDLAGTNEIVATGYKANMADLTQVNNLGVNAVSAGSLTAGGALGGAVVQNVTALEDEPILNGVNLATATGNIASINGAVQANFLGVNTMDVTGTLSSASVTQSMGSLGSDLLLQSTNTLTAAGGLSASITGAVQVGNLAVNVITGSGTLSGATVLNQNSVGNINMTSVNSLVATATTAAISGIQQTYAGVNVVK